MEDEDNVMREEMFAHIAKHCPEILFKSQQRGSPDLTEKEKTKIGASILESNPQKFISKFGKHLEPQQLSYLRRFCDTYEVDFLINEATKSAASAASVVKNRRYMKMKELDAKGEYFSLTEMKNRNPHLFNHLVGRHMTEEERESFEPGKDEVTSLSTVLMNHIDRAPGENQKSSRRKDQEAEERVWSGKDQNLAPEEDGSEDEEEEEEEELDEEEAKILMDEFISLSHRSFLEGKDKDFDYSQVDNNPEYDNVEFQDRDAEDRYFDSD